MLIIDSPAIYSTELPVLHTWHILQFCVSLFYIPYINHLISYNQFSTVTDDLKSHKHLTPYHYMGFGYHSLLFQVILAKRTSRSGPFNQG